jgi:cell wall-associated NlpC family hydrolase
MVRIILQLLLVISLFLEGCAVHAAGPRDREGISRLGYSIQVGAFAQVHNAERLTARLQSKGIEAFYFRKESGVYAVRFGDFGTYATARNEARRLVAERMISSYFIAEPQILSLKKLPAAEAHSGGEKPARPKPVGEMGAVAARTAERFVGIPYRWGGNNVVEGMDCSGFVRAVYNLCGVNIPRTSREQFEVGDAIARDELMDGDLVFFGAAPDQISHVGIYVGRGRFVHAPRRGEEIRISSLDEDSFARKYRGAKRYF